MCHYIMINISGEQIVNHEKTIAIAEHRIKQSTGEIDDKLAKYDDIINGVQRLSTGKVIILYYWAMG